jgi:hypothetical protein
MTRRLSAAQLSLPFGVPRARPAVVSERIVYSYFAPQGLETINTRALYRNVRVWKELYWFCQHGGRAFVEWLSLCWDRGYAFGPELFEKMALASFGSDSDVCRVLEEAERIGWIKRHGKPWCTPSERWLNHQRSDRQQLARAYTYRADLLTREVVRAMRGAA